MAQQTIRPVARKKPYEPPKAAFVSLKLEERLMACGKLQGQQKCKKSPLYS